MNGIKPALAIAFLLVASACSADLTQEQLNPSVQVPSEQKKPPVPGRPDDREPAGTRNPTQPESNQGVESADETAPFYSQLVTPWSISAIALGGILGIVGFWFIGQRSKSKN